MYEDELIGRCVWVGCVQQEFVSVSVQVFMCDSVCVCACMAVENEKKTEPTTKQGERMMRYTSKGQRTKQARPLLFLLFSLTVILYHDDVPTTKSLLHSVQMSIDSSSSLVLLFSLFLVLLPVLLLLLRLLLLWYMYFVVNR